MKKTLLRGVALLAVLATVTCAKVEAQCYFGFLSYSEVLHSMHEYAEVQDKMAQMREEYNKEQDRAEQDLSRQFAEFIDGQSTFSVNIMMKRQKELQQLLEHGLQFKQEARRLLKDTEAELMRPLYAKLDAAIDSVGVEKHFDFVLNTDNNACPFINKEKGEDITEAVRGLLAK